MKRNPRLTCYRDGEHELFAQGINKALTEAVGMSIVHEWLASIGLRDAIPKFKQVRPCARPSSPSHRQLRHPLFPTLCPARLRPLTNSPAAAPRPRPTHPIPAAKRTRRPAFSRPRS